MSHFDIIDSYRDGIDKARIETGLKDARAIGYRYTIELQDEAQTVKDIISKEVYENGDMILDIETGINGKITRREIIHERGESV